MHRIALHSHDMCVPPGGETHYRKISSTPYPLSIPVLLSSFLSTTSQRPVAAGHALCLKAGCAAIQRVEQQVRQPGEDLATGPGQGCADYWQRSGSDGHRRRQRSDPDDRRFLAESRQALCFWRRTFLGNEDNGPTWAGSQTGLAPTAERFVHYYLAVCRRNGAGRADLHARTAAGTTLCEYADHS